MNTIPNDLLIHQLFNLFTSRFGQTARIPDNYRQKMTMVNEIRSCDYTGIINTVLEFMIKSASVDFSFQCTDATLRKKLNNWQNTVNANFAIDMQRGLKSITAQYMRERWYSSFIGIQISWEKIDGIEFPTKIWLADGAMIDVDGQGNVLGEYKYKVGKTGTPLVPSKNTSVIIRKPFNSWYEKYPDPYLVKKGALYNALLKRELLKKQGDVLEAIIPYMMAIKAGNDAMAKIDQLPTEAELNTLVDQVKKIKEDYQLRLQSKGTIGAFAHDVTLEHLIPDLTKFFDTSIVNPIDKNIFNSLGMVEFRGFSNNREEVIVHPKMLVEEVKDGVSDLTLIYEDIMMEFQRRNKLESKDIRVVPGSIKSFVTDSMRLLARSAYDRGILSRQTFDEDYLGLDFEVEVQRSDIENRRNLQKRMFPPVILNQDQGTEPDLAPVLPEQTQLNNTPETQTSSPDIKATCSSCKSSFPITANLANESHIECPECKELLLVVDAKKEEYLQAPYENISELPKETSILPTAAKKMFMRVVNEAIKRGLTDAQAFKEAWGTIKKYYEKTSDGKWKKKKKADIIVDECNKCNAPLDKKFLSQIKEGTIECSECLEVFKIKNGEVQSQESIDEDAVKVLTAQITAQVEEKFLKKEILTKQGKVLDKLLGKDKE